MIIAIDGTAASGKGSLAKRLAAALGLAHLDTGLLYRAVGMKVARAGGDPADPALAVAAARSLTDADRAADDLRSDRAARAASHASALPGVRAALIAFQRDFAHRPGGAVLDGRDIGTVICPDADAKFFVTASAEERAARRHRELIARGETVSLDSVLADLRARDDRDRNRAAAPLKPADDAVTIDTTGITIAATVDRALAVLADKGLTGASGVRTDARGSNPLK